MWGKSEILAVCWDPLGLEDVLPHLLDPRQHLEQQLLLLQLHQLQTKLSSLSPRRLINNQKTPMVSIFGYFCEMLDIVRNLLGGIKSHSISLLVDLASSLTVENLQAMLADPETVRELQKHLPAMGESGASTESEQLRSTLQSPQFQQVRSCFYILACLLILALLHF